MRDSGLSLVEVLIGAGIVAILAAVSAPVIWKVHETSSLTISANNIRQLAAGAAGYLGDNNYQYWPFLRNSTDPQNPGRTWWFGFEPDYSRNLPEGDRVIRIGEGPLGAYMPGSLFPDPSFRLTGKPFKPKFAFGYIGIAYNVVLAGSWETFPPTPKVTPPQPLRYFDLEKPAEVVVFATSAQVNTFQKPASKSNPMIEEFYGINESEVTVHFRHRGMAMVAFANGAAGFLPMDETTRDPAAPKANIGRFAPKKSLKYLR